tara:strand:+ start:3362 stop:3907 length:546 start_codon:yes stop_codon:yes gene_type:complete
MGASSKDKGNAWELEVAKFLEEHFEGKFSRVPRSGAMFGGENSENAEGERQDVVEILTGDIITPKDFPFTIEAKHYEDFKFSHLLHGENKLLDGWIESAEKDAQLAKRLPMIMCKFSYIGSYVVFDYKIVKTDEGICPSTYFENHLIYKRKWMMISFDEFVSVKNIIIDFARLKLKKDNGG